MSLEALSDDPPAGALVVLVSPFTDVASDCLDLFARGVLGRAFAEDFYSPRPSGESWTVADLDAVLLCVRKVPRLRHLVALSGMDTTDRRVFDRLLLLLEDPPTPLLVVVTVSRLESLPGTIRGRASTVLALEVLSPAERVAALVAKGVPEPDARQAVDLAGERPSLAGLLALEPTIRSLALSVLDPVFPVESLVASAALRLGQAATLAEVLLAVRSNPSEPVSVPFTRFEDLSPEGKALAREVLGLLVSRRRRFLVEALAGVSAVEAPGLLASLKALEAFSARLRMPVSPLASLVTLWAESSAASRVIR